MLLDRPRHGRRGFAGADDDQPPAIVRRHMGRYAGFGIGRRNGGVKQLAKDVLRIHFGNQPRPASVVVSGLYSQPTQPA